MNAKRYFPMCIPGDESGGAAAAWFVFDRQSHRSVAKVTSHDEAKRKSKSLNGRGAGK